ncbi:MAG: ATP synthase subunit b [Candidatus Nomurabacteria bacterium GW2011_GWF2_35_66]|uniref:ATP synthase subunit b n=1 Tax=Candidatus Nomurabacteria bacterium GW2011_GWE1_35_16 TaxID=1618761 RepID=A0A0G0B8S1_9BACT|nr:MAG: ATP synthase subunit b [Candidatus Nomurabacteria bacterium GW2011_GWF1_34_20]KKP63405.1 MAG: ATP synthase subunit b [Candidatus Nomurabacteria bacterium GW2011_GWE2_34_25]KKP65784.1 MAG: ATP synthase subunit b [Candidatus Nomurabacteria bacterium GW2011_GWE1_35_16]KKP83643.1 MAG: ATP synthase subunit b [Candidatus Nomurabacteria bacterium GW2011_GWF2_35_66]HAE36902.1 ATP synthase F0 subunit B [Candidatus Nomurabacteria bacterium]
MDSFISTFHIDWKILIAQAINFGLVFLLIYFFALKPIKKIMKERTDSIEGGLTDAVKNAELLKKTKNEYEEVLANARIEANTIFQEGKKEAEDKKRVMIEDANKEIGEMIEKGKKSLESEKTKMIEEAKNEIVSLVVKATEKLLESHKDASFDEKTLEQIKKM